MYMLTIYKIEYSYGKRNPLNPIRAKSFVSKVIYPLVQ